MSLLRSRDDPSRNLVVGLFVVAAVFASSFLGLLRPMMAGTGFNGSLFGQVWRANVWGDLVFVVGTVIAIFLTLRFWPQAAPVRRGFDTSRLLSVIGVGVIAFVLMWLVYALSWGFTMQSFLNPNRYTFGTLQFQFSHANPQNDGNALGFTLQQGWVGLVAAGITPIVAGLWMMLRPAGWANKSKAGTGTPETTSETSSNS